MTVPTGHLLVPLPGKLPILRTRLKSRNYACRLPSGALLQGNGERRLERYCIHCAPLLRHRRCLFLSTPSAAHRRFLARAWLLQHHQLLVLDQWLSISAATMRAFALQFRWEPGQPIGPCCHQLSAHVTLVFARDKGHNWSITLEGTSDKLHKEMKDLCRNQFQVPSGATVCEVATRCRWIAQWTWNEKERIVG